MSTIAYMVFIAGAIVGFTIRGFFIKKDKTKD
jgi:hypothetical protein